MYDYPDHFLECTPKDNDIKLTECPAYEKPKKVVDIELKECPAYGQLHAIHSTWYIIEIINNQAVLAGTLISISNDVITIVLYYSYSIHHPLDYVLVSKTKYF